VDIKPYVGELDAIRPCQRLQHMEVYFSMHEVTGKNIDFSRLNIEGHALTW
jgi:hypothetical protein